MGETTFAGSGLTVRDIGRVPAVRYPAPMNVRSHEAAVACRRKLEAFEAAMGGPLAGPYRHKTHLLFEWLDALIRHPVLRDAAEAVLGTSDILVWSTSFFIK